MVYAFKGLTPPAPTLPDGMTWQMLDQEAIEQFFSEDPADRWRLHTYQSLLRRGCIGHFVHTGTEWAAVQWLATPESGGPKHLPRLAVEASYWCFNEHTRESFRRRGLWRLLKDQGVRHIRDISGENGTVLFSDTEPDNVGSRTAHERYGFENAGVIDFVTLKIPRVTSISLGHWNPDAPHPYAP